VMGRVCGGGEYSATPSRSEDVSVFDMSNFCVLDQFTPINEDFLLLL